MIGIGSVGESGSEIAQMLQRLAQQRGSVNESSALGSSPPDDSRRAEFEAKFKEAAMAAGLDAEAADGLQDEIKSAITEALQGSDGTTDRRQVIQDAIDGVLQEHGVDLEKFRSELQSATGGAGGPPPGGPPGGGPGSAEFQAKFKEAALAAGLDPEAADGLQDEIDAALLEALNQQDGTSDQRQIIQNAIDGVLQQHGVDIEEFKNQLALGLGETQGSIPLVDEQA